MEETLGYRLKQARKYNNLSQVALANQLNALGKANSKINKSMLSKWENNRDSPTLDNLQLIAKFFNRPMDYFAIADELYLDNLGKKIKNAREALGLTIFDVAQTLGVFESDWSRYENENDSMSRYLVECFSKQFLGIYSFKFMNDIGLYDESISKQLHTDMLSLPNEHVEDYIFIKINNEERAIAESYAKLHSMSIGETFKRTFFEKVEDEYNITIGEQAYNEYLKNSKKSRSFSELCKELDL